MVIYPHTDYKVNFQKKKREFNNFTTITTGYTKISKNTEAREAIAKAYTTQSSPLTAADVVIASGCSGALELAMNAIGNPGDCFLLPGLIVNICRFS